ncbi:MAG: hypothetical protein WCI89_03450 [bacterium]
MALPASLEPKPIENLKDALDTGLFGGVIDFFIGQRHYRLMGVGFKKEGKNLRLTTSNKMLQHRKGVWKLARNQALGIDGMNEHAPVLWVHGDQHELLMLVVINITPTGKVHVVLYPNDIDPNNPKCEILGWSEGGKPEVGKKP